MSNVFSKKDQIQTSPSTSITAGRDKRALDTDDTGPVVRRNESTNSRLPVTSGAMDCQNVVKLGITGQCTPSQRPSAAALNPIDLNFPLLTRRDQLSCKTYEDKDSLKLNEMVEIIGILSVDPTLAVFPEDGSNGNHADLVNPEDSMDGIEEQTAHSPPPSLVPRIHVMKVTKLSHVNPLLPTQLQTTDSVVSEILKEAGRIRDQLRWLLSRFFWEMTYLQTIFYFIFSPMCRLTSFFSFTKVCALLSIKKNIELFLYYYLRYARRDVCALGKWSLNISGCPSDEGYTRFLFDVIEQLVTKSHLLHLTLSNMNSLKFTPKKDYTANRLISGVLQLSERTHVVLDETAMESGQLDSKGVQNLTALGNAISWQKVDYDFNFHKAEFPTNVKFLTLSEGKSMLPSDCHVRLQRKEDLDLEKLKTTVQDAMSSGSVNLRQLRCYITVLENLDYDLTQDMQKIVEQDFVDVRKDNKENMSQQDLHNLLILARLMSLSSGETSLKCTVWERVKRMEIERKTRLRAAENRAGNS
ncbi:putative mini-chromosome maintenance complex-binding protein [Apostichopus japonicus]|uniref:Mini-chromosome maintenance complex-binding protein n=1 Tax=Stichopus japonicus TaxID=307972 RepID=A0A2G8KJ91_STIJA|nr:putative mini-chromosome maintenance complex-binding protein [Apostichopus japonicus]